MYKFEPLQKGIDICVSPEHKFGTDAFLLADFSSPRHKDKVCDLGTGCGIIPLLLKIKFEPGLIYGVDIQEQAIDQFRTTLEKNRLDGLVPVLGDLKSLGDKIPKGTFDVVTCNPPYKAANAGIESLGEAQRIARHEILCNIDDVCRTAAGLLKFGGKLCICNRPERDRAENAPLCGERPQLFAVAVPHRGKARRKAVYESPPDACRQGRRGFLRGAARNLRWR